MRILLVILGYLFARAVVARALRTRARVDLRSGGRHRRGRGDDVRIV
jgi:hypothetical protein